MTADQRFGRPWLVRLGLSSLVAIAPAVWSSSAASAQSDQKWIQFNFSQSQTHLSVTIESSHDIASSYWVYAGPLDDTDSCSNRKFGDIDDRLKGQAEVTKSGQRTARASIAVSRANNNQYYCFILEGYPTPRRLDYNPPVIELTDRPNQLRARDSHNGPKGPSGTVNTGSWQAAVFDRSRSGDTYGCGAANQELEFRPVAADAIHVAQHSLGNNNYLSYHVPVGYLVGLVKFVDEFLSTIYVSPETDPALIPIVDGQINELFTDNIHLCHRVSDRQGNATYQLMRLDMAGPAIKLERDGRRLLASSPAVDLDDSSWQYRASSQRVLQHTCSQIKSFPEPTGRTAVVERVKANTGYCFIVLDRQGHHGSRWIKIDRLAEAPTPPVSDPPPVESTPPPASNNDPPANQPQLTEPTTENPVTADPGTIEGQPTPGVVATTDPAPPRVAPTSGLAVETQPAAGSEPASFPPEDIDLRPPVAGDSGPPWSLIIGAVGMLVIVVLAGVGFKLARRRPPAAATPLQDDPGNRLPPAPDQAPGPDDYQPPNP